MCGQVHVPSMGRAGGRGGSGGCPARAQVLQQCVVEPGRGKVTSTRLCAGQAEGPWSSLGLWLPWALSPAHVHGHPQSLRGSPCHRHRRPHTGGTRVQQDHAPPGRCPPPPAPGLPPRTASAASADCGGLAGEGEPVGTREPHQGPRGASAGPCAGLQLGHLLGGHSVLCAALHPAPQPQRVRPGIPHASTHPLPPAVHLPSGCFLGNWNHLLLELEWPQGGGWEGQTSGPSYLHQVSELLAGNVMHHVPSLLTADTACPSPDFNSSGVHRWGPPPGPCLIFGGAPEDPLLLCRLQG